jgi:hypothetical protein
MSPTSSQTAKRAFLGVAPKNFFPLLCQPGSMRAAMGGNRIA